MAILLQSRKTLHVGKPRRVDRCGSEKTTNKSMNRSGSRRLIDVVSFGNVVWLFPVCSVMPPGYLSTFFQQRFPPPTCHQSLVAAKLPVVEPVTGLESA